MEFQKGKGKEMRQYRGLTKEGKWVYGYYAKFAGYSYIIQEADIGKVHAILKTANGPLPLEFIPVLPETVGQSTGLKDKNGKEIYEGDKVLAYYEDLLGVRRKVRGLVVKGEFGYELEFASISVSMYHFYTDEPEDFEVIGNIHQEAKP